MALAFRCDMFTLRRRVQVEERVRDVAEENIQQELEECRAALQVSEARFGGALLGRAILAVRAPGMPGARFRSDPSSVGQSPKWGAGEVTHVAPQVPMMQILLAVLRLPLGGAFLSLGEVLTPAWPSLSRPALRIAPASDVAAGAFQGAGSPLRPGELAGSWHWQWDPEPFASRLLVQILPRWGSGPKPSAAHWLFGGRCAI